MPTTSRKLRHTLPAASVILPPLIICKITDLLFNHRSCNTGCLCVDIRVCLHGDSSCLFLFASGISDLTASSWQSVSQTIHTSTTSIILPLLSYYLTTPSEQSHTLLRRMVTTLIHHVKSAEQFAPLGDLLVKKFVHIVTESGSGSFMTGER